MKSNKKVILFGCALCLTASYGCTDSYESEPVETFSIDYVFSKTDSAGVKAVQFLNYMYDDVKGKAMGHNRVGSDYLDAASDDAISIYFDNSDVYRLATGRYTVGSYPTAEIGWDRYYKAIRRANILIPNVMQVPFNIGYEKADGTQAPMSESLRAEARFLRAFCYFEMLKRYGGVPLVGDKVFDINDDLELPRNTFEQCVDYIVSELDAIKNDLRGLPIKDDGVWGHVPTLQACLALKARVLLYAASPLFNGRTLQDGNPLVGYTTYDPERWNLAAQAAKEIIDEFGPNGSGVLGLTANYRDIFTNFYSTSNPEIIWFIQNGAGTGVELNNGPLGFTGNALGNGRTQPTQNLVDAYTMIDGKKPGESTKYNYNPNDASQYDNRDPRMNCTVLHNGSRWLGGTLSTYYKGTNNPSASSLFCRTSYYMCKFMQDYGNNGQKEYQSTNHHWVVMRFAEVLLNYAEAANEYLDSPTQDIYDCIIALRRRAGIEAGDDNLYGLKPLGETTKEEMREIIHNERRVELAFEEHRYFDIRRWREAENIFSEPLQGENIVLLAGNLTFTRVDVLNVNWDNRRYLYPIPYSEVLKNSNMKQNPNW